ncbi:hypothetical protein RN001_009870 [Aquatica leii]|uniref:Peptidase M14 domain-containing protein n=1 Tax=Aquatica leii TaxID=1421715 RepID=A0AAN7SFU3_9COLE|nr:hypothetical protein RN001_009870 [Aquatica leii]
MRNLIVVYVIFFMVYTEESTYFDCKIYRLKPKNNQQLAVLTKFKNNTHIRFLSSVSFSKKPIDVMVHPQAQDIFTWTLNLHRIQYKVLQYNVKTIAEPIKFMHMQTSAPNCEISFSQFNRFDKINGYLDQLAQDYADIAIVELIGESYERRDMKVIQISSNPNVSKPINFVDAGIHAKEWIGPAMALYIINQLVENSEQEYLLDYVDWHILPVMNPDGYEYSHDYDRSWRKTRSPQKKCIGTDLNRNFDFHWGENGSSSDPCSDAYSGPYAFSEIETQNVKTYMEKWKNRIKLYVTFHSYGNYILYPWGYTSTLPDNEAELQNLAKKVNTAIVHAGGEEYDFGTTTNVLYAAAGDSKDWARGMLGIELTYTIELPGAGLMGFDPDPTQIIPIVEQTFPGIEVFGQYIAKKFGI